MQKSKSSAVAWGVIAVSVEGLDDAKKTQADFPHLLVIADSGRGLCDAAGVIHPQSAPDGGEKTVGPFTLHPGPPDGRPAIDQ